MLQPARQDPLRQPRCALLLGVPGIGKSAFAKALACYRLAALLDVPLVQAAQNIVLVAVTAAESVQRLRG